MMDVKLECTDVRTEELVNFLEKFGESYSIEYKIWLYGGRVFSYFSIESVSVLNELTRRLKLKKINFRYHRIEKVRSWLKKIKSTFKVWKN